MEKVPLCVVGCGGMGHRHIMAYRALEDSGIGNIDLVAVCDVRRENAEFGAREVERLFGRKPLIFTDLDEVLARSDILAVDVVTDGSMHHQVAVPVLEAGKHALVEKPLAITMRACQAMIDAAQRGNAVLATAENYRRDPANRLVRAILDAGLLGDPFLMVQSSAGGSDVMTITPWRHLKEKGAIYAPGERNGKPVVLRLEGRELQGREILSLLPDFHLDEITERLFGADGVEYEMPTNVPHPGFAIDGKHLAIEYHDFAQAILQGGEPELDGLGGMKAVAAIVGAYESVAVGRAVTMEEMLRGEVRAYQEEIDAVLGLE